ncbi:hypothetical protein ACRN9F_13460 [Shewanella oncorhynchi]|uniref:hypothetical protein n=1 Tax=Shewanella oncorhynchi TaxID=2726434 RepID=UPI003D78E83B
MTKLNQSVKPVLSGFCSDVRTVIQLSYVMAEFCSVPFVRALEQCTQLGLICMSKYDHLPKQDRLTQRDFMPLQNQEIVLFDGDWFSHMQSYQNG